MARQARKVDLENPQRPIVCVDLNGVLDAYTGRKHANHWDAPRPGAQGWTAGIVSMCGQNTCRHAPPETSIGFGSPVALANQRWCQPVRTVI